MNNSISIWKKIIKWTGAFILAAYIVLVIVRIPVMREKNKTDEAVTKIHATKLTMDDVLGKNLPPVYAEGSGVVRPDYNATVAGIDGNNNGIRDDVELAIFKAYPNSAKTRAVLLQYALALQMEMIQPIVNTETVTAVAEDEGRAYYCVGELTSRVDMNKFTETGDKLHGFIERLQFNTEFRKKSQKDFFDGHLSSYSTPNESCDLDLSKLSG